MEITHNDDRQRFEAGVPGDVAFLEYRRTGDSLVLSHTEVPASAEGAGVGSALVKHALDYARAQGMTVVPRCPFVASYVERHPEYQDLVGSES